MMRGLRNRNINHTEGAAVVWWEYKEFLYHSLFGGQSGPSYLGTGQGQGNRIHASIRKGCARVTLSSL